MKKIGLALGGGGAKGLCHIAFIEALEEMGYTPAIIAGTSIGAIIGGFYAGGMSPAEMKLLLQKLKLSQVSKMMDFSILRSSGMVKGKGFENFLRNHLPVKTFKECKIPLKVVATDFWERSEVILETGDLVEAIRASMSVPGMFKPVHTGSRVLIDGGSVNPLPYDIIRQHCDVLIAIDVSGEKTPASHSELPSMLESILSTFQIMQASIVKAKNNISRPDIYIKPELKNVRLLEFYKYNEINQSISGDIEKFKKEVKRKMKWFGNLF